MYHIPVAKSNEFDLDLPSSGGKVQVRSCSVEDLIEMGLIDQMDMLGDMVQKEHVDRVKKGGPKKPTDRAPKKLTKAEQKAKEEEEGLQMMRNLSDPTKFGKLKVTIDRVVERCVVQPEIKLAYISEGDGVYTAHTREMVQQRPEGIYTDNLDFMDKMRIFGAVLPSGESMSKFREGSEEALGDVAPVSDDAGASE